MTTTTTEQLTAEQAVERIAALLDVASPWVDRSPDGLWAQIHEVVDSVAPAAPEACHHVRAANADTGYIVCEDCGDWLGVWRCLK